MAETSPSDRLDALLAHREWARGLARALVRDDAEAADLEQEVWLSAVRRPPGDASSPRGWLATALRHALSNLRRGQRRRGVRERAAARPEAAPGADAVVAEAEAHRRVVDAVVDLEEPYRTAVLLRFFEGLDLPAVAVRTGVPPETARTRLKRARERLRGRLGGDGAEGRRALGLALLPLLRETPPAWAAPLLPVAGGIAMTLKTKAAVAACAVLLLLWVGTALLGGDDPPRPPANTGDAPVEAAVAPPVPSGPRSAPPADAGPSPAKPSPPPPAAPAVEHVLRVRIVDGDGEAVPGARFVLAARVDPFAPDLGPAPGESGVADSAEGPLRTRSVETDDEGRWSWKFRGPQRLLLTPVPEEPGASPDGTWVDTPALDVVLHVPRVPKGTLVIRAVDLSTGSPASGFTAGFSPTRPWSRVAEGEVLRTRVRMPGGRPVAVSLRKPPSHQPVEEEAVLADGGEAAILLVYRSKATVKGRVVGPDGLPVRDAWVWLGGQETARGDEPFKPFEERRVKSGGKTDFRGEFEVRGEGNLVSVWHPDLSPVTVPVAEAREVRLSARGSIRGVVLDDRGTPVAGQALSLERGSETFSAADGTFLFERVEAGPRGILVGRARWVVVRVEPDVEARVTIDPGIDRVDVELRSGVDSWRGAVARGVVVPLGPVGTMHEVRAGGNMIVLRGAMPGPYLLLDEEGRHAAFEISGRRTSADLGTSALVLRAEKRLPLAVLPAAVRGNPLVELLARRVQRLPAQSPEGARVEPLPAGEIDVLSGRPGETLRRTRILEPGKEAEVRFAPR